MASFHMEPAFARALNSAGLVSAESFFEDPRVKVWRSLPDRQNATVDLPQLRLHVKRYPSPGPVDAELRGHRLTTAAGLPTADLVGHGATGAGTSVIVFADLAGYLPADKIIQSSDDFDRLLAPTADLAARLHRARLHHRDLYLCHFLVRDNPFDIRLIDTARVAPLSNGLTRRRWIVKDLAQFWFSTTRLPVSDVQRDRWLETYCENSEMKGDALRRLIDAKVSRIANHDKRLNASQPMRNISISN